MGAGLIHNLVRVLQNPRAQVRLAPTGPGAPDAGGFAASMAAMPGFSRPMTQGSVGAGLRMGPGGTATRLDAAGSLVATDYARYLGRSAGSGQCVALVQAASPGLGHTRNWKCGAPVRGNADLRPGTAIATFNAADRYANATDGSSHAAIYLGQDERGIQVMDQWAGSAAAVRTIPWTNPSGVPANTGTAFHVVSPA